jgi:glutathione synthase/RimK-type ligase-like ATP-grasp enzyme
MTHILIISQPDDVHAAYVKLALECKGHHVFVLYPGDFPELQTHAFHLKNNAVKWHSHGVDGFTENIIYDVVWYRRPGAPILPISLHPDDVKNAEREVNTFFKSILHLVANDAVWINPYKARIVAMHKLVQLKAAADIGWAYPDTLVSNDPDRIRGFVKNGASSGIVYKTLSPVAWFNQSEAWLTYTKKITEQDLPSDDMLRVVPGIFQHYVDKQYEIRVTYFNGFCQAVKIDSQFLDEAKHDWRQASMHKLNIMPVQLPEHVVLKCRKLMNKLGLVFGCLDIILTVDNEYIFLEVNEQGQFLWIEDANPEIKMLDLFVEFLIAKGNAESLYAKNHDIAMASFTDAMIKHIKQAVLLHKGTALLK